MTEHDWERAEGPLTLNVETCGKCGVTTLAELGGGSRTLFVPGFAGTCSCPPTCEETTDLLLAMEVQRA